jgi:hypothetical protein
MKKGDLMTIMIKTTMWQTETASARCAAAPLF